MKKLPRIIAICGIKRSGKDTLAKHIIHKYKYEHLKIADKLKYVLKILFNLTDDEIDGDKKDIIHQKWMVTPRKLMDFIGTHVFQYEINQILPEIGRTFWINDLLELIEMNPHKRYVISDLRFVHEIEKLKKYDICVVKLCRNGCITQGYDSEKEYNFIMEDIKLDNNHTPQQLWYTFDDKLNQYIIQN